MSGRDGLKFGPNFGEIFCHQRARGPKTMGKRREPGGILHVNFCPKKE